MRHNPDYGLTDEEAVKDLVRENPWVSFASWVPGRGLVASHYPVILDEDADGIMLLSHVGRPDARLHELGEHEILAIVYGPQGYVSPGWYRVEPGGSDVELRRRARVRRAGDPLRRRAWTSGPSAWPPASGVCAWTRACTVEVEFIDSYPVTVNDPAEAEEVLRVLDERYGPERVVRLPTRSMASEDFAYILEEVPGTLRAVFDDGALDEQAALLAEPAWRRLTR